MDASQQLNNPIFTAIKQTISSTNDENDGLGTFIGTYKENKTETISEVSNPDNSKPIDLKPEISKPDIPKPIDKPQDLPISKPNHSMESSIKPISETSINKPTGKPVTNQNLNNDKEFSPSALGIFYQNAPLFFPPHHVPQFHPVIFNHPLFPLPIHLPTQYQPFAPVPIPIQLPVESRPSHNGPFAIQQPTITQNGDTIVENLIGGLEFNCQGRVTGHYRDIKFCDVFHACVFGRRKKTYACPFMGEAQYFDDLTRRCEFIRNNPLACSLKEFYN